MCYKVEQKASSKKLSKTFKAKFIKPQLYKPKSSISGFNFPLLPVLKDNSPKIFKFLNWGLIPHWAKEESIRSKTLNAKLETISEVPSFRDVTEQRCILPVTGFYEWKWLDGKGKRKEKYHIKIAEQPIFGLAGLYSDWIHQETGKTISTFSLLTTEANDIMAEIHNIKKRMPLIMDPNQAQKWLSSGEIKLNDNLDTECIENDGQLDLFS